jgi:hypothetical protein
MMGSMSASDEHVVDEAEMRLEEGGSKNFNISEDLYNYSI